MFGIKTPKKLHEDKIIDRWSTLISGGHGRGEEIFKSTVSKLETAEFPGVKISKKEVSPQKGGLGLFGSKKNRIFLSISHERFPEYEMLIGAQDYGKQVSIYWYLTGEPSGLAKVASMMSSANNGIGALVGGGGIITASVMLANYCYTAPLKFLGRMKNAATNSVSAEDMDIFDIEELSAFVTVSHHSLLDAVEELMTGIDQDFSKVEKKSRGFLNIS